MYTERFCVLSKAKDFPLFLISSLRMSLDFGWIILSILRRFSGLDTGCFHQMTIWLCWLGIWWLAGHTCSWIWFQCSHSTLFSVYALLLSGSRFLCDWRISRYFSALWYTSTFVVAPFPVSCVLSYHLVPAASSRFSASIWGLIFFSKTLTCCWTNVIVIAIFVLLLSLKQGMLVYDFLLFYGAWARNIKKTLLTLLDFIVYEKNYEYTYCAILALDMSLRTCSVLL